jgi:enterochelin esterase-like enzyme
MFENIAIEKINLLEKIIVEQSIIDSVFLKRQVTIDAYLPTDIKVPEGLPLLLINDGQDLPKMPFDEILNSLIDDGEIEPVLCVGIYCGEDRRMEYGTAHTADYKGRGAKAAAYTQFVFEELLPFINEKYNIYSFKEKAFAGFSLGALSAMDIVWNNAEKFSGVGAFSGSFWWRSKGYTDGYDDATHRIMHAQIRAGNYAPWLKFFFECGALDETKDRNKNGIIDSIDDTIDLIKNLTDKGYTHDDIHYLELADGTHDVPTWAKAFPEFLRWKFGMSS